MDFSIYNQPKLKLRLHALIAALILLTFALAIAHAADKGTRPGRSNTWAIAVTVKSAVFVAYQLVTAHVERYKRWASAKANMVLNIVDTVFWFALFIIMVMSTSGGCSGSSCALGGVLATLAIFLW